MKMRGEFYPLLSLLAVDDFDRRMRRIIEFHTSHGWRMKRAEAVAAEAMPASFKSISDIQHGRVESSSLPSSEQIPIEITFEPTRPISRLGAHERVVQLAPSSMDCTPSEHAVQISLLKESEARSVASMKDVVESVRPAFATVISSLYRGPSLAELRGPTPPFGVELDKVFLSTEVLGDLSVDALAGLERVPWEGGTFFRGAPALVTQRCWPILRRWAFAQY